MRRKHELIEGHAISCWDDGPSTADRYTVVYLDDTYTAHDGMRAHYLAMSAGPFWPVGFCQHGEMPLHAVSYRGRGGAFRKRIPFATLPEDCQRVVLQDLRGE